MIFDPSKELSISYNYLNLPQRIEDADCKVLEFTYDAAGMKLRKTVKDGAVVIATQDYVGGIEYKGGVMEAIYHSEGRVYFEDGSSRYEYSLTDHLGNTRLMFSDKNDNGVVDMSDDPETTEVLQENHYYPFGMQMKGGWMENPGRQNHYQFNGKELNEDLNLNWLDYGARWYDPSIGQWNAVDPLAEEPHNLPLTPYHFVANNPILNVDPNGLDWYQNSDGETMWRNSRDESYVDDNEWTNIGEELLVFNSENLIYYTQTEDDDGNLTLQTNTFDAVSGAPLEDGSFDYSPERQAEKGQGPLPEGDYIINPNEIQNWSDLSFKQKTAAIIRKGTWPGGPVAWGAHRVWVNPYEVDVTNPSTGERVTRTGFTIHGGSVPGSAGCIDLCIQDKAFFGKLRQSRQAAIKLIVRYP